MDVGDAGMAKMLVTISDIGSRHDFTTFILHLFDICIHHQHLEDVQKKFYISHQHNVINIAVAVKQNHIWLEL